MRAVVVGGYGNFGARICRALAEFETEFVRWQITTVMEEGDA